MSMPETLAAMVKGDAIDSLVEFLLFSGNKKAVSLFMTRLFCRFELKAYLASVAGAGATAVAGAA